MLLRKKNTKISLKLTTFLGTEKFNTLCPIIVYPYQEKERNVAHAYELETDGEIILGHMVCTR